MAIKNNDTILCPECGMLIPLSETLQNQFTQKLRQELKDETDVQLKAERDAFAMKEIDLRKKAKEFVDQQMAKAQLDATKKAEESVSVKMQDLVEQNKEKEKVLESSRRGELEALKTIRDLEESKKTMELEMMRKVETERRSIEEAVAKRFAEENRMKGLEKDKQINDMLKQIDDLKRKAEQGSQQTQGEVMELELETSLKSFFPYDEIVPIAKGMSGADIIQKVRNNAGRECGSIVWELKQTKSWSELWVGKLKEDQRREKAEVAVIVSSQLPQIIKNFGLYNGIWASNFECALALASVLRSSLIEISTAKVSVVGKNEKMEAIYAYLTGTQFSQRIETIVEAFGSMKKELDREKLAMTKIWATREKQIERVVHNTVGMVGDLQGLGTLMPTKEALELSLPEGVDDEQEAVHV